MIRKHVQGVVVAPIHLVQWIIAKVLPFPLIRGTISTPQVLIAVGTGGFIGVYLTIITNMSSKVMLLGAVAIMAPFAVMIVWNMKKVFIAIIIFDTSLQLDTYLFYKDEPSELGAIGGLGISVTTMALTALYVLWLAEWLGRHRKKEPMLLQSTIPFLIYILFSLATVFVASDPDLVFFEVFMLAQSLFLFIYLIYNVNNRDDVHYIVIMLMAAMILQGFIMLYLRGTGSSLEIASIKARIDPDGRIGGTIGSPNNAASYLCLMSGLTLGYMITRPPRWEMRMTAFAFLLTLMGMLFTQSRGGMMTFVLTAGATMFFSWRKGWIPITVPLGAVFGMFLLLAATADSLAARLFAKDDGGSAESRVPLMKLAWRLIDANPIWGVGANNFAEVMMEYATPEFGLVWLYIVHHQYLLVWAEKGPFGLISYVAFFLMTIWGGIKCWGYQDRFFSPIVLGLTAAMSSQLLHMQLDLFNERPQIQMLLLISGLFVAITKIKKREQQCQTPVAFAS
jgi:O-antigen ligase